MGTVFLLTTLDTDRKKVELISISTLDMLIISRSKIYSMDGIVHVT